MIMKLLKSENIMDNMFTENGKIRYKNYYLVLVNSSSDEIDELSIDDVNYILPAIDKYGKPGLLISYYDEEYCCNCTLSCDGIKSIREEEITL